MMHTGTSTLASKVAYYPHTAPLPWYVTVIYLAAAGSFVLSLKWLSSHKTARLGVKAGEIGMAAAIIATLFLPEIRQYNWIFTAGIAGAAIGALLAIFTPMTAVPQQTALSHAFGALAAALVGTAEFYAHQSHLTHFHAAVICVECLLGYLTFTGSLIAAGKLQEVLPTRPLVFKFQNPLNFIIFAAAVACAVWLAVDPGAGIVYPVFIGLALLFGVMLIIPIGGGDMPTVIALLNSYAGLSAAAMGFVVNNKLLIIGGALEGSSGFILSMIMCKAMNRSFVNVLFGQAQAEKAVAADDVYAGRIKKTTAEEVAELLASARRVVIVPGYGLAVAQAQHVTAELFKILEARGVDVQFAIHPVAGRMPGHMNVLLAEADIPYDHLHEMEEINGQFGEVDVVLVNGANDVVNPDARENPNSPIAGMPILNVDKARTVVVIKRSLSPGFAGIPNPLFARDNCLMLFADGKAATTEIIQQVKAL